MRRREFIGNLIGTAVAWPLAASAQQAASKLYRIGMLDTASRELNAANLAAFRKALREFGYVEGENLVIEYRTAEGHSERRPNLVSELLRLNVDVIVVRGTPEVMAVKNATSTMPVVMTAVADPVGSGVVANLPHPGGNITGLSSFFRELEAKRFQFLTELIPRMKRVWSLEVINNPGEANAFEEMQKVARPLAIEVLRFDLGNPPDLGRAFEIAVKERVDAIRVSVNSVTRANQRLIADLAAKHKLPAIYAAREFVDKGGLISYGISYPDLYSRAASYVNKIFKGAKPGDLPVEQPMKFELIINLKTAKALGITFPPSIMVQADEVIE
jgi:putative ABC transport system substrate-binding protein